MDDQAVWRRGAPVRFPSARWELTFSRALRREIGGEPHIIYAFDRRKAPIF